MSRFFTNAVCRISSARSRSPTRRWTNARNARWFATRVATRSELGHYWVVAKSVLTVAATAVLLGRMPTVSRISSTAAEMSLSRPEVFNHVPVPLVVHAAGGVVVLTAITALSIYKPWGKTHWAKRTSSR